MFSTRRSAAASSKAAPKTAPTVARTSKSTAEKAVRDDKRAAKRAAKAAERAAAKVNGKVGKADRLAASRAAASAADEVVSRRFFSRAGQNRPERGWDQDKPVYAPGEEPAKWDVSEWSLRRKVALVLAVPVIMAAVFGGLRVSTEKQLADNYAASASQVGVLGPAVDYLAAAERAAVVARTLGINDPKLDEAQQDVVEAGTKLVEARDRADLTPAQLRQVNDVISLSEQMRNGMAYVSLGSSVSQVRQLERGITQIITTIIDEQTRPEPALLVLAQALDGRLSLALQEIQASNPKAIAENPVELYREFGVELASIDRLAIALGQTDSRVLEIRQANAQRVVDASRGNIKVAAADYDAYDVLIEDLLTSVDNNLSTAARNAKVLTWVDSIIIGGALLFAIILALLVSRLLLTPIRRVRAGALEVAHELLPAAVAKIRAGEDPGEIVPIAVTTHEETGQLARAVDDLHRQAVKLASGEAALREQVGDMFVTLSRRNTSLINQQLGLIETLESDEEDPQRLESLFRLDHLASRMRRNAESLVILSGAPTRATEQEDLSLTDVLQAAIAGVQDYRRVQLDAAPAQRVSGEAAADVVHLLAELVDNSLSYSPPSSRVLVTASFTRGGVIVQVTDAGLGIAEDVLAEINAKLRSGGEVTSDTARRMGLFVVSRLAQRHGLNVQLDQNDRMGITATVFLPTSVLSDTARLEAGAGGAQVIELGAAPLTRAEQEQEYDVDADVVAYRRPERTEHETVREPEHEQVPQQDFDPIAAAINAYGLPQRRPGASGAGHDTTPASMGGGFFERVEPDQAVAELAPPVVENTDVDDVVADVVLDELDDELEAVLDDGHEIVAEEHEVDAHAEEERAPIALGPMTDRGEEGSEDLAEEEGAEESDSEESESDEADSDEADSDEAETEESEVSLEHLAEDVPDEDQDQGDHDAEDEGPDQDGADKDELAPVLATLPLRPTAPFEAPAAADQGRGAGANGNGLAARLQSLAAAARNGSNELEQGLPIGDGDRRPDRPAAELAGELPGAWNAAPGSGPGEALDDHRVGNPANGSLYGSAGALDSIPGGPLTSGNAAARTPVSMDEDETPIFRSLRSNWLSADTGERPWANSEVDAGWDAADRVEATPPTRRTETGLPMRRPGNRLIPGGLSAPEPAQTVRDPEAIRARLAAHAAGVSRGRNAASVTNPSTQEADPV